MKINISTLNIALLDIGEARVTGAAVFQEEMNRIAEIVKNVNGISHVATDLSVWSYHSHQTYQFADCVGNTTLICINGVISDSLTCDKLNQCLTRVSC